MGLVVAIWRGLLAHQQPKGECEDDMKKVLLAGFAAIILSGAAVVAGGVAKPASAQDGDDFQVDRQAMMGQVGATTRVLAGMARGEAPYEANAAVVGLRLYRAVGAAYPHMFPAGTETGAETEAGPAIWADNAGFIAASNKFEADAAAAVETAGNGLEAFQAAFGTVAQNCQACHEVYLVTRN